MRCTLVAAVMLLALAPVASRVAFAGAVAIGPSADRHQIALDRIAVILTEHVGLPMPAQVRVHVYETRDKFRHGLVQDAWLDPRGAEELAGFAIGLARPRTVLLNARAARESQEWLRLIAHELTHVAQFELAGGEGRAEQWLAEGMAEYVAYHVLERLDGPPVADHRNLARRRARNQAAFARARLDLESLGTPHNFTLRHQREGSVETYHLAFLMVDYLVSRDGFPRFVDYFGRLASEPRGAAFRNAFGQSIAEFEQEVLAHLQRIIE